MTRFEFDPIAESGKTPGTFVQTVRLIDDPDELAVARWVTTADAVGSVQLLELRVDPKVRRQGHAKRTIAAVIDQARKLHRARGHRFRRVWAGVGHKSHVIARAFLTGEGFHHVGGAGDLYGDEDLLIYVKSMG